MLVERKQKGEISQSVCIKEDKIKQHYVGLLSYSEDR